VDTRVIKVSYLPSKGLNTYIDRALLTQEACYTCSNLFVDKGALTVRNGLAATTYGTNTVGTSPSAFIVANYDDGSSKSFVADEGASTITLKYYNSGWSSLTLPSDVSITSNTNCPGTFVQYKDEVYYTNGSTIPLAIYDKASPKVRKAGIVSAESIKIIDELSSGVGWSYSGGTSPVATDYDQTHYMIGTAGTMFYTTEAVTHSSYYKTCSPTVDLENDAYGTGYDSTDNDYVAFYLYRYEKAPVSSFQLIFTDSNTYTATADIIGTVANPVMGFTNPRTFAAKWSNDNNNYKIYFVKIRRGHFKKSNQAFSWAAIAEIRFKLLSTSSDDTARVTLNYLHLRTSEPTPQASGLLIASMEGNEAWSNGTGVTQEFDYATEGMYALRIQEGRTATLTKNIDCFNWNNGDTTTQRDILKMNVTVRVNDGITVKDLNTGIFPTLTVTFTDDEDATASVTWVLNNSKYLYPSGVNTRTLRRYMLDGLITYTGASSFATFNWDAVKSIEIEVSGNAGDDDWSVYCDMLRIEKGNYQKYVASFTPGAKDYLSSKTFMDAASTVLQGIPYASTVIDGLQLLGEYTNNFGKYKTVGTGWFQMPYREKAELKMGYASLLIGAGSDKANNLWGLANSAISDDIEGFRVGFPYPRKFGSGTGNLNINDFSRYWLWEDAFNTTSDVSMSLDDDDYCRCWVWISDPTSLAKIIFRMYTDDQPSGGGFTQDASYFSFNIRHSDVSNPSTYWEYVWDASTLPNLEALEAKRRLNAEESNSKEPWEKLLDQATQTMDNGKLPDGTPEIVKQAVDAVRNFEAFDKNISDLLGLPDLSPQGEEKKRGVTQVLKWRKRDFTYRGSNSTATALWTAITGFSIEVVPKPGMSVECAFDNWYFYRGGSLSGNYWYSYTWLDRFGTESIPSAPSEMFTADNTDVILNNLPLTWPSGVNAINLYRMGGTVPEWRLIGTVGKPPTGDSISNFLDSKSDTDIGRSLIFNGYAPPKAKVMSLINNRMFYANGTDRYEREKTSRIWISEPYSPGACKDELIRDIAPNDGSEITGIVEFHGFIVVFKERSIWTLDGDDFIPTLRVPYIGCIAPKSIAVSKNAILFLSHEGVTSFNIADVSTNIGLSIKNTFTAVPLSYLAKSVGFIQDDYYWIFYNTDNGVNKESFALHLPTGIWTSHTYYLASSSNYLGVKCAFVDPATNNCFVGSNNHLKYIFNYLSGDTDYGAEIVSAYATGDVDFNTESNTKRLHAYYVRGKRITANASYTITPYRDETIVLNEAGATMTLTRSQTAGAGVAALDTTHSTQIHLPNLGVEGYTHRFTLAGTGRYSLSALQAIYHVMPERSI